MGRERVWRVERGSMVWVWSHHPGPDLSHHDWEVVPLECPEWEQLASCCTSITSFAMVQIQGETGTPCPRDFQWGGTRSRRWTPGSILLISSAEATSLVLHGCGTEEQLESLFSALLLQQAVCFVPQEPTANRG